MKQKPTFLRKKMDEQASLEEFAHEEDGWLLVLPVVVLPQLTGEMLEAVVRRKSATAGSLDGWGWRGVARNLSKVEEVGVWPEGLLDAKNAGYDTQG